MKSTIREKLNLGESDYDFYTCQKCRKLITRVEEISAFTPKIRTTSVRIGPLLIVWYGTMLGLLKGNGEADNPRYGRICTVCDSKKYQPVNLRWFQWLYPRVLKFAYLRVKGIA